MIEALEIVKRSCFAGLFWTSYGSATLSGYTGSTIPMIVQPVSMDHDFQLEKTLLARAHARVDTWQRKNRQALDALLDEYFIEITVFGRFSEKDVLNVLLDSVILCTRSPSRNPGW
jgi:hypothetical protein